MIFNFRNWVLQTFPFLEDDFDALTDYELFCKMIEYVKKFAKESEDFNKRLTDLENYINNLDLQDEVNNKLDEMAQDGTLENLIGQYIELMTTYVYNNVAEMKLANNLVNGSFARTSGFYSYNDGGGAYYKIRQVINTDVIDEMFIIALNDNNLVAELVINNSINIKNLGAKGDNIQIEDNYINAMINKIGRLVIPEGIYRISDSIIINNINVDAKGRIEYIGSDYAFIIKNANNKSYNFNLINCENGGIFKITPENNQSVIYCNFSINNGNAYKENLILDGTNGSITLNKFICKRLRSSDDNAILLTINNGNNTVINENEFIGIDIKAGKKAVYSIASGTGVEIQYKLTSCDLESSQGLYFKGNVNNVVLLNCRLLEISSRQNWITIEDNLPNITILGSGIIYPEKIELINISSSTPFIQTNLPILVHSNGYYYQGGRISKDGVIDNKMNNTMQLTIDDNSLTNSHYYTLSSSINENAFNYIYLNVSSWVEITIPNNIRFYELLMRVATNSNVTFVAPNGNTVIENMTAGYYNLKYINGRVIYFKYNN